MVTPTRDLRLLICMIQKSLLFWFANAAVFTVLVFAALNSLSYFFRSEDWGYWLAAPGLRRDEAIGFPLQIWSSTTIYQGLPLDSRGVMLNALSVSVVAVIAGLVSVNSVKFLNQFLSAMAESEKPMEAAKLQFSLKEMLAVTVVAAVVATLVRQSFGPRPELLLAVYFLGPAFLIVLAMIPRNLNWQSRIVLLVPSTILLIYYAIHIGGKLGLELDRIMLGVCIVWVPQSVIAAVALMLFHFWQFTRARQTVESES